MVESLGLQKKHEMNRMENEKLYLCIIHTIFNWYMVETLATHSLHLFLQSLQQRVQVQFELRHVLLQLFRNLVRVRIKILEEIVF